MSDEAVPASDLPSGTEVPPEDLPISVTANAGDEVPVHDLPSKALQQTYGQHPFLSGVESFGRGASAGTTDVLASGMRNVATKLGLPEEYLHYVAPSKEQLQANQALNPDISGVGNVAGQVATLTALPETKILKGAGALSKIGSAALDQSIKMMALQGGEEGSKYLTGDGDPSSVVAGNIAKAGGIGLVSGGLYGAGTTGASKLLGTTNLGNKVASAITGFGHGLAYPTEKAIGLSESMIPEGERAGIDASSFKMGHKLAGMAHGKLASSTGKALATGVGGAVGHAIGGTAGSITGSMAAPFLEDLIEPAIGKAATKLVGVPILKAASKGNLKAVQDLVNYGTCSAKGNTMLSKGIEGLFSSGGNAILAPPSDRDRDDLHDFIEDGGVEKQTQDAAQGSQPIQSYAKGGEVLPPLEQSTGLTTELPAHNMMLAAAKGRVSKYLNSIRPLANPNKLPYDTEHKHEQKEHEYKQILDLANQPLSILNKIKDGSLNVAHAGAFKAMYPELHHEISKRIHEQIVQKKVDGDDSKPPYATRQAMSLFLGHNLESTLTQPNIMAAQNTFSAQKAAQQQAPPAKNSKAELSKIGQNMQTPEQARVQRGLKS